MQFTEDDKKKFWLKVDKTETCWLWIGCITANGYGQVRRKGKRYYSHQYSWFLVGNMIPEGHLIRHKCRNRHCCNPEHLETGTPQQNSDDMKRDGTSSTNKTIRKGQEHSMAKLINQDILDIRASDLGTMKLAEKYGVGYSHIWKIRTMKSWNHI
jgi:hypothetical protein